MKRQRYMGVPLKQYSVLHENRRLFGGGFLKWEKILVWKKVGRRGRFFLTHFGNACDKMLSMEVKGLLRWKCRRENDGRFEDHKIVF